MESVILVHVAAAAYNLRADAGFTYELWKKSKDPFVRAANKMDVVCVRCLRTHWKYSACFRRGDNDRHVGQSPFDV